MDINDYFMGVFRNYKTIWLKKNILAIRLMTHSLIFACTNPDMKNQYDARRRVGYVTSPNSSGTWFSLNIRSFIYLDIRRLK